jgi:predicted metal-dependent phosphoesterase TrpH
MSPPVRLDLHVHSSHSVDGRSSVESLAARAVALGLGGLALTDHNTVAGHGALAELRSRYPSLLLLAGVEISTDLGHVLGIGVGGVPPTRPSFSSALAWVRDQGGVPIVAHPFRRPHGAGPALPAGPVAIEVVNGHTRTSSNARAAELARRVGGPTTGGSDAHSSAELGRAWTEFPDDCTSPERVLDSLRRGATEPGGRGLTTVGWLAWGLRTGVARVGRGLREI